MTPCRAQRWFLFLVAFEQLFAVRCHAASSTDTTLSACDYASENLYVVNASATDFLFPTGFVDCANATGSDAGLCEVCSCREKKVASVAGVTVAWVMCVGAGDATACVASGQEFCSTSSSVSSASCSQDGSSSCEGFGVTVGDSNSGSNANSSVDLINGSGSRGSDSSSSSSNSDFASGSAVNSASFSQDTSASVDAGVNISSAETSSSSADSTVELDPVVTLSPGSAFGAVEEDNVITDVVSTVGPSQTSAATSTEQNIIRPSDNGSTHQLDTNNGSSNDSAWSGESLTVVLSVMCGIAAVAAIAVFVAVRKDQARKRKAVGTPVDDYTDDDCSVATPMTHRLDGRYRHGRRENRYHGGGSSGTVDSSDNTPLASIVVIGPDEDFHAPSAYASTHQCRSYAGAGRRMSGSGGPRSNKQAAVGAARQQFNISHGPSMSDLPASTPDPIFDTSNTQVSFSSSMSSEYDSAPSERVYASEDSLTDSFRMVSAAYSESVRGSDASTLPRERYTSNSNNTVVNNTIVSFASSLSSLDSAQYDIRDTEASEHLHELELYTNSSRVALSFDVGS